MPRSKIFLAILVIAVAALMLRLPRSGVQMAPAVHFTLINGKQLDLVALEGHPALVVFWSLSCTPCLREIPALSALYQNLHARGLSLIAVTLAEDPPAYVLDFSQRRHVPYPIALDLNGNIARAFGVDVIPRAFLLDAHGHIQHDWTGAIDFVKLRIMLAQLIPT